MFIYLLSPLRLVVAGAAAVIFAADTLTPPGVAVAAFYAVVVLMGASAYDSRGTKVLSLVCVGLTILGRLLTPGGSPGVDLVNFFISLSAIGATTYLVLKMRAAEAGALEAQSQIAQLGRVATLGELTATIAHEVNQPLAAVVTNGDACVRWLAAEQPNIGEARQAVERMVKEANRASQVVQRVRRLVKREPPRMEALRMNDVVSEVVTVMRAEVQRNSIALHTSLSDDLPFICADRIEIQQVVLNLVLNAIEAVASANTDTRNISLSSRHRNGRVYLAVTDSGDGMGVADLNRIFDPFYTTKPDGMGMGLAISRSIVERHGGRIWATINPSQGTVFEFSLPTSHAENS